MAAFQYAVDNIEVFSELKKKKRNEILGGTNNLSSWLGNKLIEMWAS